MVNEEQETRLRKLKALLDSGALTKEEFESAKKAILNQGPFSTVPRIESVRKPISLRFLGILGLLSLAIPWNFLSTSSGFLQWHLFQIELYNHAFWWMYDPQLWFLSIILVIGFLLVLVGSILLFQRKRLGGKLLIVSIVLWAIMYFFLWSFTFSVPIGVLLCGIVGVISLLQKK